MKTGRIIQRAAFEMFRDWTKIASERYPNMDFIMKDETKISLYFLLFFIGQ